MRSLLLPFLVGFAVATTVIDEDAFRARKEYQYKYDAQVVNGLPSFSSLDSGFRLSAFVRVQFSTASKVRVKLEKVQLYQLNRPVIKLKPDEHQIPEESLRELVGPEADAMIMILERPFGFEYSHGHVVSVSLDDQETEWSANAKRGFVSMFEMNLEKRMLIADSPSESMQQIQPKTSTYKVFESSPTGDCITTYTVTPHNSIPSPNGYPSPSSSPSSQIFVTKVRDYTQCLTRPIYFKSQFTGYLPHGMEKDNPLSTGATLKYSLKGNDKKFIILSAIAESKIRFSPYKNNGDVQSAINQTLSLMGAKLISDSTEIPEVQPGQHKKNTLRMTLPCKSVDPQDPFQPSIEEPRQISNPADVYPVETLLTQLRLAAQNTKEIASDESLVYLRVLIDMLRTSPKPVIKTLWDKLYLSKDTPNAEEDKLAAKILWNIIPDVATEAAASFILDVCTEDVLMRDNCTWAMNVLTLKATPTTELINKFVKLAEESEGQISPQFKEVVYLSLGSMGFKLSQSRRYHTKELDKADRILDSLQQDTQPAVRQMVAEKKQEVTNKRNTIASMYTQTGHVIVETIRKLIERGTMEDKVLGLKSLANSGLPHAIPILRRILANPSEPHFIRILAILGHRRLYWDFSAREEVQKSLLNIYMNLKESHEIRNFAFIVLVQLKPERPILETISQSLRYEKDVHVSSLVLSVLNSYANSTFTPLDEFIRNATSALKFAPRPSDKGTAHSFTKLISKTYDEYKMGTSLQLTSIGSMYRYEGLSLNLDTYVYGLYSKFLEVGINSEGMSQFLDKLWGPRGLLTSNKSLFDLLKRVPRGASPQEAIQNIFKTLNIKPRMLDFPAGHIYFKLMDHEMRYWDATSYLRSITAEGKATLDFDKEGLSAGLPIDINTMLFLMDNKLTLPTEAGLPMSFKLQSAATIKVKGTVTAKVKPYMLEEDRQGRPPISISAGVDLKPKMVIELYGSLGLDWHYFKSSTAFRGLLAMDVPLQKDFVLDTVNKKFTLKHYVSKMPQDKPLIEAKLEPVSENVFLTNSKKAPFVFVDSVPIYAPMGVKINPISYVWDVKSLGYKFGFTGQLPHTVSLMMPIRPLSGRTILNFYAQPLDDAPKVITVQGQYIYPLKKAIATSYAMGYQETMTTVKDFGRDFSNMEESGVQKFDKYGRPLPSSLQDILPYSDPLDLSTQVVNMHQIATKFERVSGKPMPFYSKPEARAIVMTVDASTETVPRKAQLESLWSYFSDGQVSVAFTRLWRSAMPDYDPQEWQLFSEMGISYPYETYEPKDIFSKSWQTDIMKNLQFLVSLNNHKVANEVLNMTIMSGLQQLNCPAKARKLTVRALITELLYQLKNTSGTPYYSRDWQQYWRTLEPVYQWVKEEEKLVIDPSFINKDAIIMSKLEKLIRVEKRLLMDLDDILRKTVITHSELPIARWIVYRLAKTVYALEEVVERDITVGIISQVQNVQKQLNQSKDYLDSIVLKMDHVLNVVTTVSLETDTSGKPIIVTKPSVLNPIKKRPAYTAYQQPPLGPSFYYNKAPGDYPQYQQFSPGFGSQLADYYSPEDAHVPVDTHDDFPRSSSQSDISLDSLRHSLYNLTIFQSEVILQIQLSLSHGRDFDHERITQLVESTTQNITFLDNIWKVQPIFDSIVREKFLLATVQNEYIVYLLKVYKKKEAMGCFPQNKPLDKELWERVQTYLIKTETYYLGQRVSSLFRRKMQLDVVIPQLTEKEKPLYVQIKFLSRNQAVDLREFEIKFARNVTAMRDPAVAIAAFNRFTEKMDTYITRYFELIKLVSELDTLPKIHLVTDLIDAIHGLKYMTESGRSAVLPLDHPQRFTLIQTLSTQVTKVQRLVSSLSSIFDKYVKKPPSPSDAHPTFHNTIPIDVRVLEVQDVLVQQTMLLKELRKFLRDPSVTNMVLQKVMEIALDRTQILQVTLQQSQKQVHAALEQKAYYERYIVSSVFTQGINQQRKIYEILRLTLKERSEDLQNVAEMTQKITSQEYSLSNMENDINQKMFDLQTKDEQRAPTEPVLNDDYKNYLKDDSYDSDSSDSTVYNPETQHYGAPRPSRFQPPKSFTYLPSGISGLWNLTWGNPTNQYKQALLQVLASRSVEQLVWLYKQMEAMLRSNDLEEAINNRLMDETWNIDGVKDTLNSFNHIHVIAMFEPKVLPTWISTYSLKVHEYLKYKMWPQYARQSPASFMKDGRVQVVFDVSDFNKKYDMFVMTSQETNKFLNVPYYPWLKAFKPNQNYKPMYYQLMSYFSDNFTPAQCFVNKDKIQTFDKVPYQLPSTLNKCRTLLAMDCSPEKTFAVTLIKSNTSYQGHAIQIMNDDKVIEVTPGYLDVQVKVNDQVLVLEEKKPITFNKQLHYQLYEQYLSIVRKGMKVEVEFPLTGLYITVEGSYVKVQVSQLFKKKICGLCGNFDSQLSWEFEGPFQEVHAAPKSFVTSYVLPDSTCPFQDNRRTLPALHPVPPPLHPDYFPGSARYKDLMAPYRPKGAEPHFQLHANKPDETKDDDDDKDKPMEKEPDDDQSKEKKEDKCKPNLETDIKYRNKKRYTCFSEKPLSKCPMDCPKVEKAKKEKVKYVCLPSDAPLVEELKRQAALGPISSLEDVPGDRKTRYVHQELKCKPDKDEPLY